MIKDSIPISPKHGVNPSMDLCAFCHKPKGIALMGKLPGDREAPREIITDYEPCDECKEHFAEGVLIVEASETPIGPGQPPIQEGVYPTGRWMVVDEKVFNPELGFKKGSKALMTVEDYSAIMPKEPN